MNPEQIIQKIDDLEKQIPRWEKWLFICYGAAFTLLATAIVRSYERTYIRTALFLTIPTGNGIGFNIPLTPGPASVDASIASNIINGLFAPWWTIVWVAIQLATLTPGLLLAFHPAWRLVPLVKRLNLMFGYFISAWVVLFSIGLQDPANVSAGYNVLLIGFVIAIGVGYWRLRKNQAKAEEVFP